MRVQNYGSLFMEVSNPFTNAVFLLQHIGYSLDNSILFVVLCAAWIISFMLDSQQTLITNKIQFGIDY